MTRSIRLAGLAVALVFGAIIFTVVSSGDERDRQVAADARSGGSGPTGEELRSVQSRGERLSGDRWEVADGVATEPGDLESTPIRESDGRAKLSLNLVSASGAPITADLAFCSLRHLESGSIRNEHGNPPSPIELTGLTPGSWRCTVAANGWYVAPFSVYVASADRRIERDVVMESKWTLQVRARTPRGEPIWTAVHEMARESGARQNETAGLMTIEAIALEPELCAYYARNRTLLQGASLATWERDPGLIGETQFDRVECDLMLSAYVGDAMLANAPVLAGAESVTLVIDPSLLLGATGAILWRVRAGPGVDSLDGIMIAAERRWSSRDYRLLKSGLWRTGPMAPGEYLVRLRGPGVAPVSRECRVEPGRVTDLGEVLVEQPVLVSGSVVGAGVAWEFDEHGRASGGPSIVPSIVSAEDGRVLRLGPTHRSDPVEGFSIPAKIGDEIQLVAVCTHCPGGPLVSTPVRVVVPVGGVENIQLTLRPAARVVLNNHDNAVRTIAMESADHGPIHARASARGWIEEFVPSGAYSLRLLDSTHPSRVRLALEWGGEASTVDVHEGELTVRASGASSSDR